MASGLPMFGICLGHQVLGLALGGKTFKLKFGHRGANHPVKELQSGKVEITSQNHGFAVDPSSLPADVTVTHENLYDGTVEGFRHTHAPDLLGAVPPGGVAGPARRRLSLPPVPRLDGATLARSMPKRTDIKRVLVIGSGPIVIGQACEFDYSGTQACKALRAEGLEVVLVNSNPATIMTDPELADQTYVEPLTPEVVEAIIEKERPDAVLPTVGGQTALNLAVALHERGILAKYGVKLIGASIEAIKVAEDRLLFRNAMSGDRRRDARERRGQVARRGAGDRGHRGLSGHHPPVVHAGRRGRRHRLQHRGVPRAGRPGPGPEPGARDPGRGVGHRLEGVRARGDARRRRQLRGHLLDREHRPDGRPHRRLDHGGARADADRQGIPAHARHGAAHHHAASASRPAARTSSSPSTPTTAASWPSR